VNLSDIVTSLDGYCSTVQGLLDSVCRVSCVNLSDIVTFLDGYCSTVQGLLDWFEVDLGFTELLFIQIDLCVMCVFVLYSPVSLLHVSQESKSCHYLSQKSHSC